MGIIILVSLLILLSIAILIFGKMVIGSINTPFKNSIAKAQAILDNTPDISSEGRSHYESEIVRVQSLMKSGQIPGFVSLAVFILAMIVLGFNSYTTVPAGHVKVAALFGEVQPKPLKEGLHFPVNPILEFITFDIRDQTSTIEQIEVPAQDKLKSKMDISVILAVKPESTPNMYQTAGTLQQALDKYVTPKTRSLLRESGKAVETSQDFFKEEVQQQMQDALVSGLTEFLDVRGFYVKSVLIRDIDLPNVIRKAIIQTKERQEEIEQERAKLLKAEQIALKQVKEAEAANKAATENAKAKIKMADAEAYRITAEADAKAKANVKIAKSVTAPLIKYMATERWDGRYHSTIMDGTATNVLLDVAK